MYVQVETKYNVTKDGYNTLYNEMMEDMPKLLNDRTLFFDPMIAAYVKVGIELVGFAYPKFY